MEKYHYSYEEFLKDSISLVKQVKSYRFDAILSIARGGLTLGHFLANSLELRDIYTINAVSYDKTDRLEDIRVFNIPSLDKFSNILIVDDIVDSGRTIKAILEVLEYRYPKAKFSIASLFYKKDAIIKPDFTIHEAKEWIDFFWEVDIDRYKA